MPFYKIYDQYNAVYWDLFTDTEWQRKKADYAAELLLEKQLAARSVDIIRLGEQQSEHDHQLKGVNSQAGESGGHKYRDATDGGLFSFQMKCLPEASLSLRCTYYGSDGEGRDFDILIDDVKISTERLHSEKPEAFFDRDYLIPTKLTKGKTAVKVTFKAHPGKMAGGCFGVRLLKEEPEKNRSYLLDCSSSINISPVQFTDIYLKIKGVYFLK